MALSAKSRCALSLLFDMTFSCWLDRGALGTLVSMRELSAASTMKCARTARAMTLPLSICTTASGTS